MLVGTYDLGCLLKYNVPLTGSWRRYIGGVCQRTGGNNGHQYSHIPVVKPKKVNVTFWEGTNEQQQRRWYSVPKHQSLHLLDEG